MERSQNPRGNSAELFSTTIKSSEFYGFRVIVTDAHSSLRGILRSTDQRPPLDDRAGLGNVRSSDRGDR